MSEATCWYSVKFPEILVESVSVWSLVQTSFNICINLQFASRGQFNSNYNSPTQTIIHIILNQAE